MFFSTLHIAQYIHKCVNYKFFLDLQTYLKIDITDTPTTISTEISPHLKNGVIRTKWTKSVAIQTIEGLPLRLRVLPSLRDIEEDNENSSSPKKSSRFWKYLRFLGRLSLSQFGTLQLYIQTSAEHFSYFKLMTL